MKLILKNLKKVLFNISSLIAIVMWIVAIWGVFIYFSHSELIIWNLGYTFFVVDLIFNILITLIFGLFIWSTVYKILYFSTPTKRHLWVWWFASFFWILVSGCPACSISVASYLWLTWVIAVFPFSGIELKVFSLIMLLYVVYSTLKTLEVCKIKK